MENHPYGGSDGINPFMMGPGMGGGGLGGMNRTNGGGDGGGSEDMNDAQLSARLQQNPEVVFQLMMDRYREERKQKGRIRCPICITIHRPITEGQKSVCAHVSHNSLEVWVSAPCPICLEDIVPPPNIALPCGHVVCPEDFEQIGGKIVERNKVKKKEAEEEVVSDDEVESEVEFRREFMAHLQTTGVLSAGAASTLEQMMGSFDLGDPRQSTPPLSQIQGRAGRVPWTGDRLLRGIDSDEDIESDEGMPHLEQDSEDGDGSQNSMPSLVQRAFLESSSDDDSDLPPLLNRETGGYRSSDDDDSMPGMHARLAQAPDDDSNSSSDSSMPALVGRNANAYDSSNSSDDGSMPGLANNRRAANDDGSDESMPTLLDRDREVSDDSDYYDSMPELEDRSAAAVGSDSDANGSDTAWDPLRAGVYIYKSDSGLTWCELGRQLRIIGPGAQIPDTRFLPMEGGFLEVRRDGLFLAEFGNHGNERGVMHRCVFENIPNLANAQIVSDGGNGIWTLITDPASSDCKILSYYEKHDFPSGRRVRRVSTQSTIIQGSEKAVWLHVRSSSRYINAGLWFFKAQGQKQVRKADEISADAKIVADAGRGLVWVMDVGQSSSTPIISLISRNSRDLQQCTVDCEFTKDTKLIANTIGGVYVHARRSDAWGLFLHTRNRELTHLKNCPKDAKIVADSSGNAWVLQKESRLSSQRQLLRVNGQTVSVSSLPDSFPSGSIMIGSF